MTGVGNLAHARARVSLVGTRCRTGHVGRGELLPSQTFVLRFSYGVRIDWRSTRHTRPDSGVGRRSRTRVPPRTAASTWPSHGWRRTHLDGAGPDGLGVAGRSHRAGSSGERDQVRSHPGRRPCVDRRRLMEVHRSALKHGISADDGRHAAERAVWVVDLIDDVPARQLRLGFDASGRLLELIVLRFDSGKRTADPLDESATAVLRTPPMSCPEADRLMGTRPG